MKKTVATDSSEKAEDSRVLVVNCNVDNYTVMTSTGRFIGNADYLNHERRGFENLPTDL